MELNGKNIMLAYADHIVILGDTKNEIVEITEKLIVSSHRINHAINENKIKCLVMTKRVVNNTVLKQRPVLF